MLIFSVTFLMVLRQEGYVGQACSVLRADPTLDFVPWPPPSIPKSYAPQQFSFERVRASEGEKDGTQAGLTRTRTPCVRGYFWRHNI